MSDIVYLKDLSYLDKGQSNFMTPAGQSSTLQYFTFGGCLK